jgi:hypothetical protein
MAADYAGALAAIRDRFVAHWQIGGALTTPVGYVNGPDPVLIDDNGHTRATPWEGPWVLFTTVNSGSRLETIGGAGNNAVVYFGLIKAHVFVRSGEGIDDAYAKALSIGEIFRNAIFYDTVTAGCFVRTGYRGDELPRVDEGEAESVDGVWFGVTATIAFEYWHRA